jgi:hypothetical protein
VSQATVTARLAALFLTIGLLPAAARAAQPLAFIPRVTPAAAARASAAQMPIWNYVYANGGTLWQQTFAGRNPVHADGTTVPVHIIPVRLSYPRPGLPTIIYNPLEKLPDGKTIVHHVLDSPLFQPLTYDFGGQTIGPTQYLDAFQKANVWNIGGSAPGYHILLRTPVTEPLQKLNVPASQGAVDGQLLGATAPIVANIYWLDAALTDILAKLHVSANVLPVFLTEQTYAYYPGSNQCCVAFYHSVSAAGQPYVVATYVTDSGAFSADVSGLSAALAGWLDNPLYSGQTPCGEYDAGYAFGGLPNYGTTPYRLGGATYHLTNLALLPFFGDSSGHTLNNLAGVPDITGVTCVTQ